MRVEGEDFDADTILAETPDIRELTIHNIRKKDLPRMAGLARLPLKVLGIRWLSAPDLTQVPLPPDLEELMIWHSRITRLEGIERARNLNWLYLQKNAPLEDLSAIRKLPKLRRLAVVGDFNGQQEIASLDALSGLPLTELELNALKAPGLDLTPVTTLPLEKIEIWGRNVGPRELAKVCAAFPDFYEGLKNLEDYDLEGMMLCKKCRGLQKQMFLKGKKFLWCPKCSANGLAKVLAEFDAMVQQARSDLGL